MCCSEPAMPCILSTVLWFLGVVCPKPRTFRDFLRTPGRQARVWVRYEARLRLTSIMNDGGVPHFFNSLNRLELISSPS